MRPRTASSQPVDALVRHAEPDRALVLVGLALGDEPLARPRGSVDPVELEASPARPSRCRASAASRWICSTASATSRLVSVFSIRSRHSPPLLAREQPVEEERADAADVEEPGRARRHADDDRHAIVVVRAPPLQRDLAPAPDVARDGAARCARSRMPSAERWYGRQYERLPLSKRPEASARGSPRHAGYGRRRLRQYRQSGRRLRGASPRLGRRHPHGDRPDRGDGRRRACRSSRRARACGGRRTTTRRTSSASRSGARRPGSAPSSATRSTWSTSRRPTTRSTRSRATRSRTRSTSRCAIDADAVVFHVGSHLGAGLRGRARAGRPALREVLDRCNETTWL